MNIRAAIYATIPFLVITGLGYFFYACTQGYTWAIYTLGFSFIFLLLLIPILMWAVLYKSLTSKASSEPWD